MGEEHSALLALWRGEAPRVQTLFTAMLLQFTASAMVASSAAFLAMDGLGLGSTEVGTMLSAQAVVQVVATGAFGRLSDALGRKVCITLCFLCGTVSMVLLSVASSKAELWVSTLVQGLSSGFYPISDSYILDTVEPKQRPGYTGLYGAVFGVTFTVGNGLGALLLHLGCPQRQLFLVAAGLSLAAVGYSLWFLQESFDAKKRRPLLAAAEDADDAASDWSWGIVGSGLACVWACNFFYGLADGFMSMYPFLISDLYSWTDAHFATVMAVVGLGAGLVMLFVFPRIADALGAPATLGLGCAAGALAYALFPRAMWLHLIGLLCFIFSVALFNPSVPVAVGLFTDERFLGFASGVGGGARCAAGVVSPIIAGHLYKNGPETLVVGSAFFAGGVIAAVGAGRARTCGGEQKPLLEA